MKKHMRLFLIAICILVLPSLASVSYALDLNWATGALDQLGPLKAVVVLLLAGSIGTAAVSALVYILDLPVIREAVGGVMWTAGKASSLMCVRWFGKHGQKIEDKLQRFIQFLVDRFFAGLDQDDRRKG